MIDLTIELSYEDAARLARAFNDGRLPSFVTGIRLEHPPQAHLDERPGAGDIDQDAAQVVE